MTDTALDRLAAELHAIYQAEAQRQGDVRHPTDYAALPENIKEYDRVLARWILARDARLEAAARRAGRLEQAENDRKLIKVCRGYRHGLARMCGLLDAEQDRLRREVEK